MTLARLDFAGLVNDPAAVARPGSGNGGIDSIASATLQGDVVKDVSYRRTTRIGRDIKTWLDQLEVLNKAPRTLDQYERDVAKMALLHPELPLREFTDEHILRTLRTWPAASRYVRSKAIGNFFGWAVRTRRLDINPMQWVPEMRRGKEPHIETFTPTEVDDLLALPARDAVLIALLFGYGLRKEDASGLQVRRIRTTHPAHIVILGGKGDRDRKAYARPGFGEIVAEFLLHHRLEPTDHLWYTKPGGGNVIKRRDPLSSTAIHMWWHRCLDDAGVRLGAGPRERNMHIARHTYATEWLRSGGRLETLRQTLGHANIKETDRYTHMAERDILADLAVMSDYSTR